VGGVALAGGGAYHGNALVGVARRAAETQAVTDTQAATALYPRLAAEMGVGVAVLWLLLVGVQGLRTWWMKRVPSRLRGRHLGGEVHLWKIDGKALIAGLITAAVGAVLTAGLVRSDDPQQVSGGLILGFAMAALIGHAVAPNHRPLATLIAPAVVGGIGYAWAGFSLSSAEPGAVLAALYARALPGLALGLPLHYLTAGVLGCAIGIGMGQVLERAKLG